MHMRDYVMGATHRVVVSILSSVTNFLIEYSTLKGFIELTTNKGVPFFQNK